MINNITITGRLTKDIELKYTGNGTAVVNFTLAVNRTFKGKDGEQEADFIQCVVWKKTAEVMANFTKKGSLIGIEGRIQTRNYDNAQGTKVFVTEVVVEKMTLLESKTTAQQTGNNNQSNYAPPAQTSTQNNYKPNNQQQNNYQQNDPFSNAGGSVEINEDDMPF